MAANFLGKFQRGGAESFLKWEGPRGQNVRVVAEPPGRPFSEGGAAQGAWFSSAAVTMTSIQIRMASGLGATM